jgi:hypothetical protein
MIGRPGRRSAVSFWTWAGAGLLGLVLCGGTGCTRLRTPEAACELLLRGISEGDASSVFDALLVSTQWSFATVQKNHRAMRDLIKKSYPGEQQPAALARLYGAEADSGRDLFQDLYTERFQADFQARAGSGPPLASPDGDGALCQRQNKPPGAKPFRLGRMPDGRWGMMELDRDWDEAKLRAVHDLETVKKNAELFQKARP